MTKTSALARIRGRAALAASAAATVERRRRDLEVAIRAARALPRPERPNLSEIATATGLSIARIGQIAAGGGDA